MLKTFLLILVSVSVLMLSVPTSAGAQTAEDTKQAEKVKLQVAALGDGATLSVRLRDKKKLTGDINYIGADFFTMTDTKTKASQKLAYSDVAQIERKADQGFPKWAKIAIGVVGVMWVMGMITNGGG